MLIRRAYRIGVQTVEYDDVNDQCWVTIKNHSYSSEQPVPHDTARRYYEAMQS